MSVVESSSWPTATASDSKNGGRSLESPKSHPGTTLNDAMRSWPTPRAEDSESCGNHPGAVDSLTGATKSWPTPKASASVPDLARADREGSGGADLETFASRLWPTPAARDYKGSNSEEHLENGTGRKHLDQLPNFVAHLWRKPEEDQQARELWPTPAAAAYGSSQNGINGKGGANERPSANTPGLEKLSHSFHPDQPRLAHGGGSSPSDQSSRQRSPSLKRTSSDSSCRSSKEGERLLKPRLNPQFVEWLMGFPIGWTGSALAATELSRWRRQLRLEFLRLVR